MAPGLILLSGFVYPVGHGPSVLLPRKPGGRWDALNSRAAHHLRHPAPTVEAAPEQRSVSARTGRGLGRRQRGKFAADQHTGHASADTSEKSSAQTSTDGARLSGHQ